MQDKLFEELYDIINGNKNNNSIVDNRIAKYNQAEKIIIEHSKYEYDFLLNEFSCFIKNILKDYNDKNDLLLNRVINEKEIVYGDYYTKDATKYLKEFLEYYNLGTVKYNKVIMWNKDITVNNLITSYYASLEMLKTKMISTESLKKEYLQMLNKDKIEYEELLTEEFKNFIKYIGIFSLNENIPLRVYYNLQINLEVYNYDVLLMGDKIDDEKNRFLEFIKNNFPTIISKALMSIIDINAMNKDELIIFINSLKKIDENIKRDLELKKIINRKRNRGEKDGK